MTTASVTTSGLGKIEGTRYTGVFSNGSHGDHLLIWKLQRMLITTKSGEGQGGFSKGRGGTKEAHTQVAAAHG